MTTCGSGGPTTAGDESTAPATGEIRLRVERFGLTANNVTYGAFGDQLGYWRFFPAPEGWGRIPVWGFGVVTASGVDGVAVGERFYGYFPMSSTVTLQPRVDGAGFVECSPARADLWSAYNGTCEPCRSWGSPPPTTTRAWSCGRCS